MENLDSYYKDNPERLHLWMKESVETLKDAFGVENLSNNELFFIKKIAEDVIKRYELEKNVAHEGRPGRIEREIVTRFLTEAYGIDPDYIESHIDTEKDEEGFQEYIRRTREKAHLI